MGDLSRLANQAKDSYLKRREGILKEFDEETAASLSEYEDMPQHRSIHASVRADRRAALEKELSFQATVAEESEETTGDPEDMLQELDRRTLVELGFVGRFRYSSEKLEIAFKQTRFGAAVRLHVRSDDVGWARATFSHLSDEIDKGRPWWSWVHSTRGSFGLQVLTTLVFLLALLVALWPEKPMTGTQWANSIICLLVASFVLGAILTSNAVLFRLFPPFEITEGGTRSTGGGVLIYALTLVVSIVVSIWVNVVS